jgi:hypothetical protein
METQMRSAVLIGIAAAVAVTAGCSRGRAEDGGPTVQRNFQVGSFDQVEVAGPFDVTIRTGADPSVSATGNEKLIERLEVVVEGSKLQIRPRREGGILGFNWGSRSGSGEISITVPSLSAASLAGSGGINIDKVEGDRFEGQIAGSGDLRVENANVGELKLGIAGSGDARVASGKVSSAQYDIAGSGDVDASGVSADAVNVSIAGAGAVRAHASRSANVDIMGSGDVEISGGAKCNVSKMGSGEVRCS